jgi:hypothetical protein
MSHDNNELVYESAEEVRAMLRRVLSRRQLIEKSSLVVAFEMTSIIVFQLLK